MKAELPGKVPAEEVKGMHCDLVVQLWSNHVLSKWESAAAAI